MHSSLKGETNRANNNNQERAQIPVSERSLIHKLWMRADKCHDVEHLNYCINSAVAKEHQVEKSVQSPSREKLLSDRPDVHEFVRRFPLYIERSTADITDALNGVLYSFFTEIRRLIEQ